MPRFAFAVNRLSKLFFQWRREPVSQRSCDSWAMQPSSSRRSLLGLFTPRRQRLFADTSHFLVAKGGNALRPNDYEAEEIDDGMASLSV